MHAEMTSFVQALLNGQLSQPSDPSQLPDALWNVILKMGAYVSASSVISVMTGRESYQLPDTEKDAVYERAFTLPLYQQMMAVAVKGCTDLELMNYKGHYSDNAAVIFLTLYSCLSSAGFTFSNDEYDQVMDGTHELYVPWKDPREESPTEKNDDVESDYDDDYIEGLIAEYENDNQDDEAALPDSLDEFVNAEDLSEIPFKNEVTEPVNDEYPTVYSTEEGFASAFTLSDTLDEIVEAA